MDFNKCAIHWNFFSLDVLRLALLAVLEFTFRASHNVGHMEPCRLVG